MQISPSQTQRLRKGSASAWRMSHSVKEGPIARIRTFFGVAPVIMNPPTPTFSSVCTRIRVDRLTNSVGGGGVGVAVGLGLSGVGVGVIDGTAVAVGVTDGVGVGVPHSPSVIVIVYQHATRMRLRDYPSPCQIGRSRSGQPDSARGLSRCRCSPRNHRSRQVAQPKDFHRQDRSSPCSLLK